MTFAFVSCAPYQAIGGQSRASFALISARRSSPAKAFKKPRHTAVCCVEPEAPTPTPPKAEVLNNAPVSSKPWHFIPFLRPPKANREAGAQRAARGLWRVGWLTWWVQLVLTTISAVILLFAFAFPGVSVQSSASKLGLVLTGLSVVVAIVSLFWTYSYTRFSMRLSSGDAETSRTTLKRLSTFLRVGSGFTFLGVLLALLGLQATVGTLLARLFTAGAAPGVTSQAGQYTTATLLSPSPVQAVDILVVQATANAMSSLFTALLSTIWLQGRLQKWQLAAGSIDNER